MINIRPAHASDLDAIAAMLPRVVDSMQAAGNDQWQEDYPRLEDFARDIELGQLWVTIQGGRLVGAMCVNDALPPEYDSISWTHTGPCLTIHRLAVDPDFRRQGLARAMLSFAQEHARTLGMTHLRVDTYSLNLPMQQLFLSQDFQPRGEFYFSNRTRPFLAYEKEL